MKTTSPAEDFLSTLKENLRLLLLATGYLFGLQDGHGKDLKEVAPKSVPLLDGDLGQALFRFRDVLLTLWERAGEWASYDEFLALNAPTEALLNDLDLYVRTHHRRRPGIYGDSSARSACLGNLWCDQL